MHGQFCWYELTTPDVDASKRFYPRFTGWGTQSFDENYTMWTSGGVPIAGIFRLNDQMKGQGVPPNWMPYIEASSVDETAKKAKSLGGKVVAGPDDIPGTGRFAVIQDPQGATFGIYKSNNPSGGWDGTAVTGRFSWHELMTSDHAQAFDFYRSLFGWDKNGEMDMGDGQMYLMYGQGNAMYGGMFTTPPEMEGMHPFWLVYIHVDDVGKAVDAATRAGAFVQRPRMEIPGGTIAILGDPQGAAFAVHDTKSMSPVADAAAATVAKAGAAVKKAASRVATALKKAARKVKKAAPKKTAKRKAKAKAKTTARAKTKAKTTARAKAKAKVRPRRAKAKTKTRTRAKAKSAPKRKAARRPALKKSRRTARAKSRRR